MNKEEFLKELDKICLEEKQKGIAKTEERCEELRHLIHNKDSKVWQLADSILDFDSLIDEDIELINLFFDKISELEALKEDYESLISVEKVFEANPENQIVIIEEDISSYVKNDIIERAYHKSYEYAQLKQKRSKSKKHAPKHIQTLAPIDYDSDDALFEEVTLVEYTGPIDDFNFSKKRRSNSKRKAK